ncbi:MAG TPA: AsmA-like C-terminal region-containing protein, partial [Polyangia bacterium]
MGTGHRARNVLIGLLIAVAVVAAALIGASFALDSYVHRHERELLGQLESRLGRKVDVGRLDVSLWRGLTAERVVVGGSRAAGDEAPLLTIERVRLRPQLARTLATLGRRVQVRDVELVRPALNLVRLADGSFNVDEVADHWRASAPSAEPARPMSERTRRMIEGARLREARIEDGHVRFVDRLAAGRAVDVGNIQLTLTDVGLQRRPSVELHAAVLSAQPNLALRARLGAAGSLDRLPPPVESARLQLSRTDLGPLMPIVGRFVAGLEAGVASADLDAQWTDVAVVKGGAELRRARFAGGAPFDATLTVDAGGDARTDDLDVRRLELAVGDMALVAHGGLRSLAEQPRFEGFALESRNLDFDDVRRLYPRLDRRLGATLHGPVQLRANASAQRFSALVDLTAASIDAPGRFDKPRGMIWRIDANGHADKRVIAVDALTLQAARQTLRARGTVRVGDKHPPLDVYASTDGLSLAAVAPLVPALARAGLPPMVVSTSAHLSGRAGLPDTMALDVDRLTIAARRSDLSASGKVRGFARPQLDVTVRSSYLDTADLMPTSATGQPAPRGQPAPHGAPPTALARLGGRASVSVARGVASGIPFDGLHAVVTMRDGVVRADRLDIGAWGGRVFADGSDYDVARGPFHVTGRANGVDVEQLLERIGGARQILAGRLTAQLDVRGRGTTPAELERSLTGTLDGTVGDARLLAFNLDELLGSQLVRALPLPIPMQRLANVTSLGTLRGRVRFADGAIILDQPLTATTPEGPLALAGRFFFDGRLDLTGTLQLSPAATSALFADRIRPSEPLPLSLRLSGNIHRPTLGIANLADVGKVLVRGAVGGALIPGQKEAKVPSRDQIEQQA